MKLIPHSVEWYDWLSKKQTGYFYPQRSTLPVWHGEDVFRELVFAHLTPEMDVLEVACAQGELALALAPRCRSVLGYDVTPGYIDLARAAAEERGIGNARFVVHNSKAEANAGSARMPAADQSVDLWVNSKGPFHPILDAPRVCRPGAALLMLVPEGWRPAAWEARIPEPLRIQLAAQDDPDWARKAIEARLGEAGLRLHSWWDFDVPEVFTDPRELYVARAWPFMEDEVPPYAEAAPAFEQIFRDFAAPHGLEVRRRRHIWKAVVD
jgi:SAM-dependent methyltransferase